MPSAILRTVSVADADAELPGGGGPPGSARRKELVEGGASIFAFTAASAFGAGIEDWVKKVPKSNSSKGFAASRFRDFSVFFLEEGFVV